jgi:aldehyde:ferredoxin oxidoreductase
MNSTQPKGYMGKILRVDLSKGETTEEFPDQSTLRQYVGGTGLGIKYLYDEVPPEVQWNDPKNRLIFATGPVGGTRLGGSGSISVVTKGPLTNGATSTQTNGFIGAFLKFSGFDAIIAQGASPKWVYLYIHDGTAEVRDAAHLLGKDTWETGEILKKELGKKEREMSVFCIGPAGEHLVAFASIGGDKGHVASHGGAGAVMGSKRLKAIAISRGKMPVDVADKERLSFLAKDLYEKVTSTPGSIGYRQSRWGTTGNVEFNKARLASSALPVKNYTTTHFPKYVEFSREYIDPLFEIENAPCWACRYTHCRMLKVKEGPYAGYVGEEPEYEQWAHWGPVIGQKDQIKAFVLSNEVDRLGMDTNHAGWVIAWLMECYDKEILSKNDLDGLEMDWGNAESALAMLRKIAMREGVGDVLAKGISRAIESFPPEARKLAIYTKKGNTPRAHDHRSCWRMMMDTCVSDTGTDEAGSMATKAEEAGLPKDADPFSPEVSAKWLVGTINRMPLDDCLVMCRFNNRGPGVDMDYLAEILKAATGFDFTGEEVSTVGYRVVNLLRSFNIRHGITADMDMPSPRYGSAPIDGPFQGVSVEPVWRQMVDRYYELMGWDVKTGKPLPATLKRLNIEFVTKDIW